jgi:hypothetical protein
MANRPRCRVGRRGRRGVMRGRRPKHAACGPRRPRRPNPPPQGLIKAKDPRNLRLVGGRSHLPPRVPRAQVLRATGPWPEGVPPRSHPRQIPEGISREHPRVNLSARRGGGRLLALRPVGGAPGSVPDRWPAGRPRDPPPDFPAGTSGAAPVGLATSRFHPLRCLPSRGRCSERADCIGGQGEGQGWETAGQSQYPQVTGLQRRVTTSTSPVQTSWSGAGRTNPRTGRPPRPIPWPTGEAGRVQDPRPGPARQARPHSPVPCTGRTSRRPG